MSETSSTESFCKHFFLPMTSEDRSDSLDYTILWFVLDLQQMTHAFKTEKEWIPNILQLKHDSYKQVTASLRYIHGETKSCQILSNE